MTKIKIIFGLITTAFAVVISSALFFPHSARAAIVSPVRYELQAQPGQSLELKMKVTNDDGSDQVYFTQTENFDAIDESGQPNFTGATSGLATWITATPNVPIAWKETTEVAFTINVPAGAANGSYSAALFVRTTPIPSAADNQVAISSRVGALIFLQVGPQTGSGVSIETFTGKNPKHVLGMPWYWGPRIDFLYRFSNYGEDRVTPKGEIVIENSTGKTVAVYPVNTEGGSVLPKSVRAFNAAWNLIPGMESIHTFWDKVQAEAENFYIGPHTAQLKLTYDVNNEPRTLYATYDFLLIPWHVLAFATLLSAFAILLLIIAFRWGNKRGKQDEDRLIGNKP